MDNEQRIETFRETWNTAETFFAMNIIILGADWLKPIYEFIFYAKYNADSDYPITLRAGQSLQGFMLSRALEYGLAPDQPFVEFKVDADGPITVCYYDGETIHEDTVDQLVLRGDTPDDFRGFAPLVRARLDALTTHPLS
jgi:hypothetical protein